MSRLLVAQRALTVPGWAKDALWRRAQAIPSLDLRFADNKSLVDATTGSNLITFTRASSATFVDSDGVLQTAVTDAPRFDHNPATGEGLGLLMEDARTNLLLQSNGFNTTWSNSNSSETAAAGIAPDGTNTAWELKDTVDGGAVAHALQQTISFTNGTAYTFTVFAKQGTQPNCALLFPSGRFGAADARFNLSAGTVTTSTGVTATITAFANNWYRCAITATATSTGSGALLIRTDNGTSSVYQGDGTGTILIYGAQLEADSFPSSYIATTTATVTRSADVCSITGSEFSGWYRQDQGTLFASASAPLPISKNRRLVFATDGTTQNRVGLLLGQTTNYPQFLLVASNTLAAAINISIPAVGFIQSAAAYALNDFAHAVNGLPAETDTSGGVPSTVDHLTIGAQDAVNRIYGHIRRITFWKQRLPNNVLQQITQ